MNNTSETRRAEFIVNMLKSRLQTAELILGLFRKLSDKDEFSDTEETQWSEAMDMLKDLEDRR